MAKDYYQTLGVSKTASAEDIKRAYRKLAHEHHPDKKGGNADKFKEINEAYQVLSDDKKRQQYDAGGFSAQGGPASGWDFSQGFEGINFEDVFDVFGSAFGGHRTAETRGQDLAVQLTVTLTDALLGAHKALEIEKESTCQVCGGNGGTDIATCTVCNGKGQVREEVGILFGSFSRAVLCSTCYGSGKAPKHPCKNCKGHGRVRGRERIEFDLPAGVEEGAELSLKGKGQAGFRGAKHGDLHFRIHIKMPKNLSHRARELVEELGREL